MRKELHNTFTVEPNLCVVKLLRLVTFELSNGKYKPYRDDPLIIIQKQTFQQASTNSYLYIHKQAHFTSLVRRPNISGKSTYLPTSTIKDTVISTTT
jgi:CMP-N-acetylneuraminic acid synthetase